MNFIDKKLKDTVNDLDVVAGWIEYLVGINYDKIIYFVSLVSFSILTFIDYFHSGITMFIFDILIIFFLYRNYPLYSYGTKLNIRKDVSGLRIIFSFLLLALGCNFLFMAGIDKLIGTIFVFSTILFSILIPVKPEPKTKFQFA